MPISTDGEGEPDFAVLDARAKKRQALIFGIIAVVVLGGAGGVFYFGRRAEQEEARKAAAELRDCLLGAPLEPGESAARRVRRRQLGVLALSDTERALRGGKLWPLACRESADRMLQRLAGDAPEAQRKGLADLIREFATPAAAWKDLSEPVEQVMALLDTRSPGPASRGTEPIPSAVPGVEELPASAALSKKGTSLNHSYTEDNPGASLPVLVDEEGLPAPLFCSFRAESREAACRTLKELGAARGHGLRLLGTSDPDAEHLVFAGRRGSEGVFLTGSATPLDKVYSYGGYAAADGSAAILGWDEAERSLVLVQAAKGQRATRTPLKPNFRVGNFFYGSQLLWDQVLVRGITPDNERRLFVLPIGGDKKSFGLADIGELPEAGLIRAGEQEQPHLTGCRTQAATVVRVRGSGNDFLTFRLQSGFTAPVGAPAFGVLGCYGTTATVVWAAFGSGGNTRIFHDACTTAGCTHSVVKGQALDKDSSELRPQDSQGLAAVDLGGKLLVAWLAGERGGLRMRLAPPETFDRAPDVVLVDDHVLGGKNAAVSTVLGFRLYSREGFAVLLVSSLSGLHAFRIDPSGTVAPYSVKLRD